jgi:aspartyl/asparaginyl beta-hydroxylase (cupin superfamily)
VGTGVVFDTTFMHSAYNDGDVPAEILFIDFWHPELSSAEQTAITCLQRLLREQGEAGGV